MMAIDDFCCHVFSYNLFAYLNINSVRYNILYRWCVLPFYSTLYCTYNYVTITESYSNCYTV